jgi:hypothetical protein
VPRGGEVTEGNSFDEFQGLGNFLFDAGYDLDFWARAYGSEEVLALSIHKILRMHQSEERNEDRYLD